MANQALMITFLAALVTFSAFGAALTLLMFVAVVLLTVLQPRFSTKPETT